MHTLCRKKKLPNLFISQTCKSIRVGLDFLVTFPLVLVETHGQAEGVDGEGEHYGGALLGRDGAQRLKEKKHAVRFNVSMTIRDGICLRIDIFKLCRSSLGLCTECSLNIVFFFQEFSIFCVLSLASTGLLLVGKKMASQ